MCRGSGVVAAGKKLTTINLPGSSSELAVGVHLVTAGVLYFVTFLPKGENEVPQIQGFFLFHTHANTL